MVGLSGNRNICARERIIVPGSGLARGVVALSVHHPNDPQHPNCYRNEYLDAFDRVIIEWVLQRPEDLVILGSGALRLLLNFFLGLLGFDFSRLLLRVVGAEYISLWGRVMGQWSLVKSVPFVQVDDLESASRLDGVGS